MWLLIDRERMILMHKHPSMQCINDLDYIESFHIATVTLGATHKPSWNDFSDYELKLLHENICGQKFSGFQKDALINAVADLCGQVPVSDVIASEAAMQAAILPFKRDEFYRYKKGAQAPEEQVDIFKPSALVSVEGYVPDIKPNYVPKKRPVMINTVDGVTDNQFVPIQQILPDPTHRPSRKAAEGPVEAPKAGGKTRMVWDIADAVRAESPNLAGKELRKVVAERCEAAGVNSSTMSVQFSKYKAHHSL